MKELKYVLSDDYIELIKLLKLMHLAESGAHAKMLVEDGLVMLNGKSESRKRAKLHKGDIVYLEGVTIVLE